jgi:hypothetical protein
LFVVNVPVPGAGREGRPNSKCVPGSFNVVRVWRVLVYPVRVEESERKFG